MVTCVTNYRKVIFAPKTPGNLLEVIAMVVSTPSAVPIPSPSLAARKNRRRIKRKSSQPAKLLTKNVDEDHEMNDAEASTSNITDQLIEMDNQGDDDEILIDDDLLETTAAPTFPALAPGAGATRIKSETRRIPIPPHRMTPIKKDWINIFGPLTEILGLQVRMNVQRRCVEIRVCQNQSLLNH